jgi:hypothetical protein
VEAVTSAQWAALMATAGEHVGIFIGGGVGAAVVLFAMVMGIRRGVNVLRYVAYDHSPQAGIGPEEADAILGGDEGWRPRGEQPDHSAYAAQWNSELGPQD